MDGSATAFTKKCLAALVLYRTLWASWTAAFGRNPSNDLSPQGVRDLRSMKMVFLPCKQDLQVKVPVQVMLSTSEAPIFVFLK